MKIRNLIVGFAFIISGAANAAMVFSPTDNDVNFILFQLSAGTQIAMFDDDAFGVAPLSITGPQVISIAAGGSSPGDYTATNESLQSINLSDNDYFTLGYSTDSGLSWMAISGAGYLGANTNNVTTPLGSVTQIDAQVVADMDPVPIPGALWLFGSALVGLTGVSTQKSKA